MGHSATALVDYMTFRGMGWGPGSNATALLNVRYILSRQELPGMKKVFGDEEAVYFNRRAVPRAFAVSRFHSFGNREEMLGWLRSPLFSPGQSVLLADKDLAKLPPGFIETRLTEAIPENLKPRMLEQISLGYFGSPEDVAVAVSFLASAEARYITGVVLSVDGGMFMAT